MSPATPSGESDRKKPSLDRTLEEKLFRRSSSDQFDTAKSAKPQVKLTRRQQLERSFRDNPSNVSRAMELAQLHLDENRPYDAERVLATAVDAADDDPTLLLKLEDVKLLRSRHKLAAAEDRAKVEKTDKTLELVQQLRDEHNRLELEIYTQRSERNADDQWLAYEFGLRLKRTGDHHKAFELFERALTCPQLKALASLRCGECQQRFEQYPKAMQLYRQAIEFAMELDQVDCRKLSLYRAAVLAGGMRLFEASKRYYRELLGLDPDYRDARDKLAEVERLDS